MRGSGVSLRSDAATATDVDIYQLISNLAGKVEELEAKLESAEAELVLHKDKATELETKLIQLSQDNNASVAEIAEEVFESHSVPEELLREAETYKLPSPNGTIAEKTIGLQGSSVGLISGGWCLAYTLSRLDSWSSFWNGVNLDDTTCTWIGSGVSESQICRYDASYWRAPASWTFSCANCPTPYAWNNNNVFTDAYDSGVNYWKVCA